MQSLSDNPVFYTSIVSIVLLTISETLPYIRSVESNGILQTITNAFVQRVPVQEEEQNSLAVDDVVTRIHSTVDALQARLNKNIDLTTSKSLSKIHIDDGIKSITIDLN